MTDADPLASFRANIAGAFGLKGETWLEDLPALLATLSRLWQIEIGPPFPMASFNFVAPAVTDSGRRVVLKAGVPCAGFRQEMAALRRYGGRGAVRLIRGNGRLGAMLLERIEPGGMLVEIEDDDATTRIAAACMQDLWTPLPERHPFQPVREWADGLDRLRERFDGGTGPLPSPAVERAEGLFRELFASSPQTVLLHGDLHHYNILRDGEGWRVIDPKGVAGDPCYDCGPSMYNPGDLLTRPNVPNILTRRIAIFSEMLGFDRERIRNWAYAQAVLSAWWCLEDATPGDAGDDRCWKSSMAIAESLSRA